MIDPIERLVNDAVAEEIGLYVRIRGRRDVKCMREGRELDDPIAKRMTAMLKAANRIGDAIDNREYHLPFPEIDAQARADLLTMIRVNGAHWWAD